jgi:hypothetical protein
VEERESFHPRPRLYFWQEIEARVPRESTIHTLEEIATRRQERDGLVSGAERERLVLRFSDARKAESFRKTR